MRREETKTPEDLFTTYSSCFSTLTYHNKEENLNSHSRKRTVEQAGIQCFSPTEKRAYNLNGITLVGKEHSENIYWDNQSRFGHLIKNNQKYPIIALTPTEATHYKKMQKKERTWCYYDKNTGTVKVVEKEKLHLIETTSTSLDGYKEGNLNGQNVIFQTNEWIELLHRAPTTNASKLYRAVMKDHDRFERKDMETISRYQINNSPTLFKSPLGPLNSKQTLTQEEKLTNSLFLKPSEICQI